MYENTAKTKFSKQLQAYYDLPRDDTSLDLEFVFSKDNCPDLLLTGRDKTVVALQYNSEKMNAPAIKVKGKNQFARQIIRIAEKNKIPIIEDNALTAELYSEVSTNNEIPEEYYMPLAELYAKILRNDINMQDNEEKNKKTGGENTGNMKKSSRLPERILLELGEDLIPLAKYKGSPLVERIKDKRKEIYRKWGFEFPPIKIVDNLLLERNEYRIKINGNDAGHARINMYLVLNKENAAEKTAGKATKDPLFGMSALWIYKKEMERAKESGHGVFDPVTVIVAHIAEICKRFSTELVGRDEVQNFLDGVKEKYPVVVNDTLRYYSIGEIKKVIHGLLKEGVPITNKVGILEALADYGELSHNCAILVEKVRQKLRRQICSQYADKENKLHVLTINSGFEERIVKESCETPDGTISCLAPEYHKLWIGELEKKVRAVRDMGFSPVILCSEDVRVESLGEIKIEFG
jgi:flagellar biosynthesis component FlhA